jgi:GH25 family lysozyme M1 (1,4-beta-N-acetylmuramidase)
MTQYQQGKLLISIGVSKIFYRSNSSREATSANLWRASVACNEDQQPNVQDDLRRQQLCS